MQKKKTNKQTKSSQQIKVLNCNPYAVLWNMSIGFWHLVQVIQSKLDEKKHFSLEKHEYWFLAFRSKRVTALFALHRNLKRKIIFLSWHLKIKRVTALFALHPNLKGKKHFSLVTFDWPNFIKLILKILYTTISFALKQVSKIILFSKFWMGISNILSFSNLQTRFIAC